MEILNVILSGVAVFVVFGAIVLFLVCNLELDMMIHVDGEYYDFTSVIWFICTFAVTTVINVFYDNVAYYLTYAGGILVTYVCYMAIIEEIVPVLFFRKKTLEQRFKINDFVTSVNIAVLGIIILTTIKYKIYG